MTEAEQVRVLRVALRNAAPTIVWACVKTTPHSSEEKAAFSSLKELHHALDITDKATGGER